MHERMNAAFHLVDENAQQRPDSIAIYYKDEKISYRRLHDRVNQFGNALKKLGVRKGDRFVCRMPNRPEAAVAFLAGIKIGAVPIPSFPLLKENELEYIVNVSDAVALVANAESLDELKNIRGSAKGLRFIVSVGEHESADYTYDELIKSSSCSLNAADVGKDDLAFLCFTSGTTGKPKGLPHKHESCLTTADIAVLHGIGGLKEGDILFTTSPFGFSFGLCTLIFYPFRYGVAVVYSDKKSEPEQVFEILDRYQVTHFITVTAMYHQMLNVPGAKDKYDLRHLRILKGGAMEMPVEIHKRWKSTFGLEILLGFGMQEIIGSVISNTPDKIKYGSIGVVQPQCEARVVDENDKEVSAGVKGRLAVKVPCVIPYYWKDPKLTEEHLKDDGWLYTDDVVYQDHDGFFYYVGRVDNVIISSGWTISPVEIENVMKTHPVISEAAVIAVSHESKGKIPAAAVVMKKGVEPSDRLTAEIKEYVKKRLAPYKCPREIYYVDSLPKTATGKIKINELREIVEQRREPRAFGSHVIST